MRRCPVGKHCLRGWSWVTSGLEPHEDSCGQELSGQEEQSPVKESSKELPGSRGGCGLEGEGAPLGVA